MEQKLKNDLNKLCSLFLNYIMYTKKLSPHTLRAYENDLRNFFNIDKEWNFFPTENENSVPNMNKDEKENLEKTIKNKIRRGDGQSLKLNPSSRSRKLSTIKSFIKWLADQDWIKEDFRYLFKSPRQSVKIPNFLSIDEILFLKDHLKKEKQKNRKDIDRDRALFFLLYGGGLRVSEACHLKTDHVDWLHQTLKIEGKGNKERLIAIPHQAMEHLKCFKDNSPYIFGKQALPERKAYDIIKQMGIRAGLLKPLHPHALRHSFATHLLVGGANLRVLQKLLGHKSLQATQKYTHLDLAQLSQTLEKFHPIQKKKLIAS